MRSVSVDRWLRVKERHRCVPWTIDRYRRIANASTAAQRARHRPTHPSRWTEGDFDHLRAETARSKWAFGILLDFARFTGNRRVGELEMPARTTSGRVRWLDRPTLGRIVVETRNDPLLALVVILGLGHGMRRVEWMRMQMSDVDLEGGRMLVRGKGRGAPKLIWVPLHPAFPPVWRSYLTHRAQQRRARADPALEPPEVFVHTWRGRLRPYSASGFDRIVRRIGRRLAPSGATPRLSSHMLRRSGATLLEEVLLNTPRPTLDGVYRAVQAFLRHDDLATTMRYLQGNPARQRRALADYGRALPWAIDRAPVRAAPASRAG